MTAWVTGDTDAARDHVADRGDDGGTTLVARLEDRVVGLVTLRWTSDNPAFADRDIPLVHQIVVAPEFRRSRVATALMDSAEQLAATRGREHRGNHRRPVRRVRSRATVVCQAWLRARRSRGVPGAGAAASRRHRRGRPRPHPVAHQGTAAIICLSRDLHIPVGLRTSWDGPASAGHSWCCKKPLGVRPAGGNSSPRDDRRWVALTSICCDRRPRSDSPGSA